jgi:UDP-N-acetylglucosamine:LPS N-acetylglucosamine transferase
MKFINKKIIIATGGTGGHIFPAYSLAKNLIKKDYLVEIITDERGLKFLDKKQDIKLILNNSATIFKKKYNKFTFFCVCNFIFIHKIASNFI